MKLIASYTLRRLRPFTSAHRFFFVGLTYSWGVVQAQLTMKHLAKDSSLSFVGSTATSFVAFGALINARILRRLGTRNSALLACFCLGFGQILSGFATTNFGALFVSFGIVTGFGVGLCFMVTGLTRHNLRAQEAVR